MFMRVVVVACDSVIIFVRVVGVLLVYVVVAVFVYVVAIVLLFSLMCNTRTQSGLTIRNTRMIRIGTTRAESPSARPCYQYDT